MRRERKKRRLKTWPLVLIFFIVTIGILIYCAIDIKNSLKGKGNSNQVQVLNEIKDYGYKLEETDSKYFKTLFNQLKKLLEENETVDEEAYASLVSQLFITDFYSLDASINKNDIGGRQFVYSKFEETFLKLAKGSVYKYVENNTYGKRKQDLPSITNVEVTDIKKGTYKSDSGVEDEEAFDVSLKVTYKEDLGYPTVINLTLIHEDNKLVVASMKQ